MYLPPVNLIRTIASHLLVTDLCFQFGRLPLDVRGYSGSKAVAPDYSKLSLAGQLAAKNGHHSQNTKQGNIEHMTVPEKSEWRWLETVKDLLKELTSRVQDSDSTALCDTFPFLDSANESLETLEWLVSHMRLRDAYVISRVIYETLLNACFITTDRQVLGLRAHTHAQQKALRGLVRAIEISGEKIFEHKPDGVEEIMNMPLHKRWLDEFTSRSGREVTSWTPENVSKRLEVIHEAFGLNKSRGFAFGLLLYRYSSEIAHGTLFGTMFSWGAMEIGKPLSGPKDMAVFRKKELQHLMKLLAYSIESAIKIISALLGDETLSDRAIQARADFYGSREEKSS